jgi:hypothetical protein
VWVRSGLHRQRRLRYRPAGNATYDNAPGRRLVGRQEIAAFHQRIFDSVLRDSRLGSGYAVQLQPIARDVMLVHASGAVLFAGEDEAKVPPNGLLTMVAARRGDRMTSLRDLPNSQRKGNRDE